MLPGLHVVPVRSARRARTSRWPGISAELQAMKTDRCAARSSPSDHKPFVVSPALCVMAWSWEAAVVVVVQVEVGEEAVAIRMAGVLLNAGVVAAASRIDSWRE